MSCCCLIWAAADWMKCVCLDIFLAFLKRSCVCITSITYIRQIYETGQTNLHPLSFSSSSSCSLILFGFPFFSASTRCAWWWATHLHTNVPSSSTVQYTGNTHFPPRLETRLTTGFQVRSMTDTQQKHTAPLYNLRQSMGLAGLRCAPTDPHLVALSSSFLSRLFVRQICKHC